MPNKNNVCWAKIPTGLIYSYYKNKGSLFDAVLRPVLYDWERVFTARDDGHSEVIFSLTPTIKYIRKADMRIQFFCTIYDITSHYAFADPFSHLIFVLF